MLVVPPTAVPGEKFVIVGATLKIAVLVPVPTALVMLTGPVTASAGTTAFSEVAVTVEGMTGAAPLKSTAVAPVMFVPVIVTSVPTGAGFGEKPVARGGCWTVRVAALVAVPSMVVTAILPVVAPRGTVNWSAVGVLSVM